MRLRTLIVVDPLQDAGVQTPSAVREDVLNPLARFFAKRTRGGRPLEVAMASQCSQAFRAQPSRL